MAEMRNPFSAADIKGQRKKREQNAPKRGEGIPQWKGDVPQVPVPKTAPASKTAKPISARTPPAGAMASALMDGDEVSRAAAPAQAAIAANRPAQIQRADGSMANLSDVNQERRQRSYYGRDPRPGDAPITDEMLRQRGAPNTRMPSEREILDQIGGRPGALTRETGYRTRGDMFRYVDAQGRQSFSDNIGDAMGLRGGALPSSEATSALRGIYDAEAQQRAERGEADGLDPRLERLRSPSLSRGDYLEQRRRVNAVAAERPVELAREQALLQARFLPEGSKVQKTPADQLAERQQAFTEGDTDRKFAHLVKQDEASNTRTMDELRGRLTLMEQQGAQATSAQELQRLQAELLMREASAKNPYLRPMPSMDPEVMAGLEDEATRTAYQKAIYQEQDRWAEAFSKYQEAAKRTGKQNPLDLWQHFDTKDLPLMYTLFGPGTLQGVAGEPRKYAEGGPVYNMPPDAASAESALGRYRDYMVQAQQMGLPTIPFEQFAQIQEASGPVQRYAMGGALYAHRQNAETMARSGILVDQQGLQEQELALKADQQRIDQAKNLAEDATTRRGQTMASNLKAASLGARSSGAFENGLLSSKTMESPYGAGSTFKWNYGRDGGATKPSGTLLSDLLGDDADYLGFARGGPVPGALEDAQQAPSEPKFVLDPDPDAPVDSIPAVIDDHQPARLNSGEFVFPTDVVQFYGLDRLNKMIAAARKGQEMQGA